MDYPDLTVSNFMENSIGLKRVNINFYPMCGLECVDTEQLASSKAS